MNNISSRKDTLHCAKCPSESGYENQKIILKKYTGYKFRMDASHSKMHSISSRRLAKKSRIKYNLSALVAMSTKDIDA